MKYFGLLTIGINALGSFAFAGSLGSVPSNHAGYYLGIGGAYNNTQIQSNTLGVLNAGSGSPPLGLFSGGTNNSRNNAHQLTPELQVGYFKHFNVSKFFWGLEFLYQYSNFNVKTHYADRFINLRDPISGVSDSLNVNNWRTQLNDTLMLPIFVGQSFKQSFLYAGIGPSLFYSTQKATNINDTSSGYYIGNINNYSKNQWIWGGAVQTGLGYFVNSSWFLKLHYSCAFTGKYPFNNTMAFVSDINNGLNSGTLLFNSKERLISQEIAISINKAFFL